MEFGWNFCFKDCFRLCTYGAWTVKGPSIVEKYSNNAELNWNFVPGTEEKNHRFNLSSELLQIMIRGIQLCL
jgi:hypothetical protein